MAVSAPALQLIRGSADPCTVTLSIARTSVLFWERTVDKAVDALLDATATPDMTVARLRLEVAHDRLVAARNRRDRLISELQGIRWLWLVEEGAV